MAEKFSSPTKVGQQMHAIILEPAIRWIEAAKVQSESHSRMEKLILYAWACTTISLIFMIYGNLADEEASAYEDRECEFLILHILGLSETWDEDEEISKLLYEILSDKFSLACEDIRYHVQEAIELVLTGDTQVVQQSVKPFFRDDYSHFVPADQVKMDPEIVMLCTMALFMETVEAALPAALDYAKK